MVKTSLIAMILGAAMVAPAQAQQPQAPKLDLSTDRKGCVPAEPGEVVVCGQSPDKYRIDPDVLEVMRRQDPLPRPEARPLQVADGDPCKIGPNGCPGENALPVLAIALVVAKIAAKAATGEDWREPLRTRPDDYQLYLDSRAKREKPKASVTIGAGVGPAPERPGD